MTLIASLELIKPPTWNAQDLREAFKEDPHLPNENEFEEILRGQGSLPSNLQVFDLVFPRVISPGLREGGGADQVTDDSILYLVFVDSAWQTRYALAGPRGWGCRGPDYLGPRARLVRFKRV